MESELEEILQKFSLAGNKLSRATLDLRDLEGGVRECKDSHIGRVVGEKNANLTGVKNFVQLPGDIQKI